MVLSNPTNQLSMKETIKLAIFIAMSIALLITLTLTIDSFTHKARTAPATVKWSWIGDAEELNLRRAEQNRIARARALANHEPGIVELNPGDHGATTHEM